MLTPLSSQFHALKTGELKPGISIPRLFEQTI